MVSILAPSAAKLAAKREADAGAASSAVAEPSPGAAEPPSPASPLLRRAAAAYAAASAALSELPNSCFAASPPTPHPGYSLQQRAGAALWTAALYGALGLVCGGAGQARPA